MSALSKFLKKNTREGRVYGSLSDAAVADDAARSSAIDTANRPVTTEEATARHNSIERTRRRVD